MRVVQELMTDGNADFRRVYPFVFGFIKILLKKFNFLISESNSTLESLKNPFALEEEEEIEGAVASKRQPRKENAGNGGPNKRDGVYQALNKARKNFIDLTNVKYHGLDQGVFEKIEEALKMDVLALQQKNGMDVTFMKKEDENEDDDSMMQDVNGLLGAKLSAIKKEYLHDEDQQHNNYQDIRNMADVSGDFLKSINQFADASPISPSIDQVRAVPREGGYQNNLNLSLDL